MEIDIFSKCLVSSKVLNSLHLLMNSQSNTEANLSFEFEVVARKMIGAMIVANTKCLFEKINFRHDEITTSEKN